MFGTRFAREERTLMGIPSQLRFNVFLIGRALRVGVWLFLGVCPAFGQLSPGPLSRAHQALDGPTRCTSCHLFGVTTPKFDCSQCHEEIRSRIVDGRGYHGLVANLAEEERD